MRKILSIMLPFLASVNLSSTEYAELKTIAGNVMLPYEEVSPTEVERLRSAAGEEFLQSAPPKKNTPVSLKSVMSPVRRQGIRGTCSVFASVALMEAYNPGHDFSEQCLAKMSNSKDGGYIQHVIEYAGKNGLYSETDCPYDASVTGGDNIPSLENATLFFPTNDFSFYDANISDPITLIHENLPWSSSRGFHLHCGKRLGQGP